MTTISETLLTINAHPGDSIVETVTGEKHKGDGYYGRSDGLHTVQYTYTEFTGVIDIQASLAVDPTDSDWFTVISKTISQESKSEITSFTGNYVWIRARVEYTDGTINSVVLNH